MCRQLVRTLQDEEKLLFSVCCVEELGSIFNRCSLIACRYDVEKGKPPPLPSCVVLRLATEWLPPPPPFSTVV